MYHYSNQFETIVAQGSNKLEIPAGITAEVFQYYGYNADAGLAMIPATGATRNSPALVQVFETRLRE